MDNSEVMTIKEAMEFLSIGKNTIYSLLSSGELKGFRIGKLWRIHRSSVQDYIRCH